MSSNSAREELWLESRA
ncbi:Protein of unknown function [Propionibacterium freudenreichii]|nr:Protein of unknown function [Propionibacterium freudenreichii]